MLKICNIHSKFVFFFSNRFYHGDRQIFIVSGILNVEANSPSGVILTLHSDGAALNTLRTGVFTNKENGKTISSYSMAGILELPKDIPLQLFIYLSNMESYKVMAGSRISVSMAQQDYQAFHIAQPFPVSHTKSAFYIVHIERSSINARLVYT